jgi:hypothetical protein
MRLKNYLTEITGTEDLYPMTLKKILKAMDRNGWKLKMSSASAKGNKVVWWNFSRAQGPEGAQFDEKAVITDYDWDNRNDGTFIVIKCYNFSGMPSKPVAEVLAGELKSANLNAKATKFKRMAVVLVLEAG